MDSAAPSSSSSMGLLGMGALRKIDPYSPGLSDSFAFLAPWNPRHCAWCQEEARFVVLFLTPTCLCYHSLFPSAPCRMVCSCGSFTWKTTSVKTMDFTSNARNWCFCRISPFNHWPTFCKHFISYGEQQFQATEPTCLCLEEWVSACSSKTTNLTGCRKKRQTSIYALEMSSPKICLTGTNFFVSHTSNIELDSQIIRPVWTSLICWPDCLYCAGDGLLWMNLHLHARVFAKKYIQFCCKHGLDGTCYNTFIFFLFFLFFVPSFFFFFLHAINSR